MAPDLRDAQGWSEEQRDALLELAQVHTVLVDRASRMPGPDEPEWVLRLRKVCLHVVAIVKCPTDLDGVHAMGPDLRAAYEQMGAVWKHLPAEFRFEEDRTWWSHEARNGLAGYCHPTIIGLTLPVASGGFADMESPAPYLMITRWLGRLACGYALALAYLARFLRVDVQVVDSRLESLVSQVQGSWADLESGDVRSNDQPGTRERP